PVLTALLAGLVAALLFVRSALTGAVVVAALAGTGALWWWRDDVLQQHVLVGVGVVLLVGAWRHLATVLGRVDATSDVGVLARLTWLPAPVWQASFVLVLGLSTWLVVAEVLAVLGGG